MIRVSLSFFLIFFYNSSLLIIAQNSKRVITNIEKEEFVKNELYGKIRTVTVNKYFFIDTVLEPKPFKKSIFTFNSNSDLTKIEYIDYFKNDTNVYYQEFDNKHNIIKEYTNKSKDTSYYQYDNFDRLVTKKSTIYDTIITTLKQSYDSSGRLIEKYQYHLTSKYLYDKDNRYYTSVEVYNRNGKLLQTTSFNYDSYGNCNKEIRTTYDGNSISKSQIEYKFEKSRLIYLKNSWAGEFFTYYDDIGSIIKATYPDGDIFENKIVYDDLQNEIRVIKYKNGKSLECYDYIYSYFE